MSSRCRKRPFLLFSSVTLSRLPVKHDLACGCFSEHGAVTFGQRKCGCHMNTPSPPVIRDCRLSLDDFSWMWSLLWRMETHNSEHPSKKHPELQASTEGAGFTSAVFQCLRTTEACGQWEASFSIVEAPGAQRACIGYTTSCRNVENTPKLLAIADITC
jgi:hypothetical protein